MIIVTQGQWNRISRDYKGGKVGERSVFGGCIQKDGGTALLKENIHFVIVKEKNNASKST